MKNLVVLGLLLLALGGCGEKFNFSRVKNGVVYNKDTRIMYYKLDSIFSTKTYMAPYYSSNGKLCKYVDSKIVEVN